ncbi:coiled-coil domain-containing protein 50 isoform X1 [Spea bombifrons]|uniref:coiled-coil domain-containing protein 50 isoform X1 n=1 Tax=Spea bombifrons TaxID=233779 RepID=UPI00234BF632|nr:coiled-coil domain-containing protein 50 isoform X1 [Spea bombifrons]
MTEISIDNSKLPGVKEVVRDFAVLEDHTLAHTLQEQEIEHHLATNIQRNRLVKKDLQVAKQLQQEEDLQAQARIKNRHNELELLDVEIAQEIQEKLVIEAELRRRQEEKDEDIARLLQEKEEKRRKNYPSSPTQQEPYLDHGGHRKGRHKESEYDRHHRHERPDKPRKERNEPRSEYFESDTKIGIRGHSAESRPFCKYDDDTGHHRHENHPHRSSNKKDRPGRPPPPRSNRHEDLGNDRTNGEHFNEHLSRRGRSQSHEFPGTHSSGKGRHHEHFDASDPKCGDCESERHRRRTPSPKRERQHRDTGCRPKGTRDTHRTKSREEYDAEIARKLQERELKVNVEDVRAAQLAQDEEIARWLMEKEERAYKKSKSREKTDKRRPEEWEQHAHEHVRPRSREGQEQHRSKSDKPYRPLPPAPDEDHEDYTNRSQHNSPRPNSKSQSSHKGSYYRP